MTEISIDKIKHVLRQQLSPMLADRGGDVIFDSFEDGVLCLRPMGSPGAVIPILGRISAMLRHYVPAVHRVELLAQSFDERSTAAPPEPTARQRVQHVLDTQINPSVAAHQGEIALSDVRDGVAFVLFTGGCQGCAMANVTLRQGVEVLIKQNVPEIIAVHDVTDHSLGTRPHFKTQKGAD